MQGAVTDDATVMEKENIFFSADQISKRAWS